MEERNEYNQSLLSRDQQRDLVLAIVKQVGWEPMFHEIPPATEAGRLLSRLGLRLDSVYLSIKPEITLHRDQVPHIYSQIKIDVTQFTEGEPWCNHSFIELYWEVGGGMMDSGVPHRYVMCRKCCRHEKKTLSPSTWWERIKRKVHMKWIGA